MAIDVMERLNEHCLEASQYFPQSRMVALCLQGSQNYNLATAYSDVDTKLVVVPSFEDIAFNSKPVSTTHIRANEEHIDFKDLRLYLQTFRKQNVNFIEILFTKYKWINPTYESHWNKLVRAREEIAHYSPYAATRTMLGIANEKFHALKHPYPSKLDILAKYGYDPKQLHHLIRIEEFLLRYIDGVPYEDCLRSQQSEYMREVKLGKYSLEDAESLAARTLAHIQEVVYDFCDKVGWTKNEKVEELLDEVQYDIMKIAIKEELNNDR